MDGIPHVNRKIDGRTNYVEENFPITWSNILLMQCIGYSTLPLYFLALSVAFVLKFTSCWLYQSNLVSVQWQIHQSVLASLFINLCFVISIHGFVRKFERPSIIRRDNVSYIPVHVFTWDTAVNVVIKADSPSLIFHNFKRPCQGIRCIFMHEVHGTRATCHSNINTWVS